MPMPTAGSLFELLERLRAGFAREDPPEAATADPDTRTEVQAYLTGQRVEMCQWLLFVRVGLALGVAGYLALGTLVTAAVWPTGALLLALAYAGTNGAVCLGAARLEDGRRGRVAPYAYAFIDVGLVIGLYGFFGGALAGALPPGVVLVGLLVLVLLVYTLLGHPMLSTILALAALGVAAGVFYLVPGLAEGALPAGTPEASLRAYLLVEYLSIACLVTCLLALRLRRRRVAHRTELHRRLRAHVEADLETERRRQIEAVGRLKRDFIAVLSHELRNPIAPLVSSLEVAQQDAEKGRCNADLVGIATSAAHQLQHLVDDYTRLAKLLTRPPAEATRQNVPLAPLAEAAATHLTERIAEQPDRHLPQAPPPPRFSFEDLAGCAVAADPPLLNATLHALLLRAARYASGGTPVTVRGFAEASEAGFTVHDPDSYLDADSLASLDDLFAPTDERLYSEHATGLELLLARHAMRRLGGRLDAESSPEHGTTVRCILPAAADDTHDWISEERARRLPDGNHRAEFPARARA